MEGDRLVAAEVPKAYCPACQREVEVPEGARPGDLLACCGGAYRLSYEFGAWALDEPPVAGPETAPDGGQRLRTRRPGQPGDR